MSATVLLVEDDRELRHTLRDALLVEGYRVHAPASLVDARALLAHSVADGGLEWCCSTLGCPMGDGETLLTQLHLGARDAARGDAPP